MIKLQKPKLYKSLQSYQKNSQIEENYLDNTVIENQESLKVIQDDLEFNGCMLKSVLLNQCACCNFSFIDSTVEFCDCSNLSFSFKSVIRTQFSESKFVGIDLSDELIQDVLFENCDFTLANFSNTKFQNVLFKNCLFRETRIFTCTFQNVEFANCTFENIEIFKTPLKDIDISTCTLLGGKFCPEDLKGMIVNTEQALSLARLLGITICDDYAF